MLEILLYKDCVCLFASFPMQGGGKGTGGLEDCHLRRSKTCIALHKTESQSADKPTLSQAPVGAIVGITIGILLVLILVTLLILKWRRRQEEEPAAALDDDSNPVYGMYMVADPVVEVEDANLYYSEVYMEGTSRVRDNNSTYNN